MGLDYGSRTVGVAISDELLLTAQAREIIRRKEENKLRKTLARIEELIQEYDVQQIVLGLPLNMDQSESVRSVLSEEFRDKLERRTSLPVIMWDERLTTVEADAIMDEAGIKKSERKEYVDMIAAQIILQDYLDNRESFEEKENNGKDNISS
jgi:putative Holliday junction resolvase